jgi:hypothetical protein
VTIGQAMMSVEDLSLRDRSLQETLKIMKENLTKARKKKHRVPVV